VLAGIPAFGYLLYFTGRVYSAAYQSTIGIPDTIVTFEFWDHMYFGARDFRFLISLAFSVMLARFVLYLTEPPQWYHDDHYPRFQYGLIIFYFVWAVANFVLYITYMWLNPALKTQFAYSVIAILFCFLTSAWSLMILFDRQLLARIRDGRIMSQVFPIFIVIVLVLFPYIFADASGRFEGVRAENKQPLVELYARYPVIDDFRWESTSSNSCRTVGDLRLLFSNQQYLVVESVTDANSLYIVKMDDILSIKIAGPEE
jgi:hypothetical protein